MLNTGKYYLNDLFLDYEITPEERILLNSSKFIITNSSQLSDENFFKINNFILDTKFKDQKIFLIKENVVTKVEKIDLTERNDYMVYFYKGNRHYTIYFRCTHTVEYYTQIDPIYIDLSIIKDVKKLLTYELLLKYFNKLKKFPKFKTGLHTWTSQPELQKEIDSNTVSFILDIDDIVIQIKLIL